MVDDLVKTRKDEKVINDLLSLLPETNVGALEISHIEALITQQQAATDATVKVMSRFAQQVQSEIPRQTHFFNFYDVPDLIVRKQVTKKDYEVISKLLTKVKREFLV